MDGPRSEEMDFLIVLAFDSLFSTCFVHVPIYGLSTLQILHPSFVMA
jgi:hypothetical protein